jgi:hypothetical protein
MSFMIAVGAFLLLISPGNSLATFSSSRPTTVGQAGAPPSVLRACAPSYGESLKKKHSSHGKRRETDEAPTEACLEIKGSALEVQEYLQKLAWELKWSAQDEQTSEDLWSISIALGEDELLIYAKPFSDPRVEWHAGKAVINAQTTGLPDSFTRVVINAKFEGYGAQIDQFAPKRNSWPLPSNGKLEAKIADSLRAHFIHAR